jgi:multiple sugar transport system permease protein
MTDSTARSATVGNSLPARWETLKRDRNWLGFWFMLPAMAFLLLFLAYPLLLGIYMSFTDVRIGRPGVFIGVENYAWMLDDPVFWMSVFNTMLYTVVASVVKFAVGLYLALLLNKHMPFKAVIRANGSLRHCLLVDL